MIYLFLIILRNFVLRLLYCEAIAAIGLTVLASAHLLDRQLFSILPPMAALVAVILSYLEDIGGNLGWLLAAPISRKKLWLVHFSVSVLRAVSVMAIIAASVLLGESIFRRGHGVSRHIRRPS